MAKVRYIGSTGAGGILEVSDPSFYISSGKYELYTEASPVSNTATPAVNIATPSAQTQSTPTTPYFAVFSPEGNKVVYTKQGDTYWQSKGYTITPPAGVSINSAWLGDPGKESQINQMLASKPVNTNEWVDPATGQSTPVGVGVPKPTANQLPAGATYISNEKDLAGLTENQIWRDPTSNKIYKLQQATLTSPTGQKKVVTVGSTEASGLLKSGWTLGDKVGGGAITPESLQPATPLNIGTGTATNNSLADVVLASAQADADTAAKAIAEYQKLLTPPESDLSKQVSTLLGEVSAGAESLTGRGAAQLTAEEQQGISEKTQAVTDKTAELNKKIAEVNALTASYNLANQQAEGVPMTLSRLQGAQAANYRNYIAQKNMLTAEAGYMQAELLGLQNNLTAAQNAANRAVDLEYSDRESAYNAKIAQLQILQPQLDEENATYAKAVTMYLQQRADALAEEKQNKKEILNIKLQAISAGITDPNILNQIGNAKSYADALQILGTNMPAEAGMPSISEQLAAIEAGYTIVDGKIVAQQKTGQIVTDASGSSYDIGTYATDPNHEASVQSILDNMGQMTSVQQMNNYIQSVAPGSPVTGQMVANASEKYGVSWETIMAIMQQDSSFGTAGAGARSFNPGNVGNTETATATGQLVNFGNWQTGVDAVAKNLAGRKTTKNVGYEKLSPLAKSVWDGTLDLKDITPTQRAEIAPELNDAGWTNVVAQEQKSDFATTMSGIDEVLNAWTNVPDSYKGFLQGRVSNWFKAGEWNEDVATFNASVGIVGMQLTRLFEKGRISDQDRDFYMSLMPNLRMNKEAAEAGAKELKARLEAKLGVNLSDINAQFSGQSSNNNQNSDPLNLGVTNNPLGI